MLANQETVEESYKVVLAYLEGMKDGFNKEMITKSLEIIIDSMKAYRLQTIWINALKEGLEGVETRLDKLEEK